MAIKRDEKGKILKGSGAELRRESMMSRARKLQNVMDDICDGDPTEMAKNLYEIAMGRKSLEMMRAQKNLQKRGGRSAKQDVEQISEESEPISVRPTFREQIDATALIFSYQYGKPQATINVNEDTIVTHQIDLSKLSAEELKMMLELQRKVDAIDAEVEATTGSLLLPNGKMWDDDETGDN